ncbi:MAG: hypothetical protein PHW03_07680 [Eubacteriales bacterium]|nr:hypothetical protein [Eubacteriales bacterium]MDD4390651.1 hypothetical protein [Eubacteriales bacterium]
MGHSLDFKDVFLGSSDLEVLASVRYGSVVSAHPVSVKFLVDYRFISHYALSDVGHEFVITPLGIRYLEYLDGILLKNNEEEKRLKLSELRSWIALSISVIALIYSLLL